MSHSGGVRQVSLSWPAVSGADSYSVYRGTQSDGEATTPVATVSGRGTFDIGCDMKEGSRLHRDLGMKGQLVVE